MNQFEVCGVEYEVPVHKGHHGHKWIAVIYATYFGMLKEIAEQHGYALAVHGSFTRDMDLIAVPWINNADDPMLMLAEMKKKVGFVVEGEVNPYDSIGNKPHGRIAYTIAIGGGGYIDISVMPRINEGEK